VEHHDLTRRTLLDLDGITDVVIVSRPVVLPVPERTSTARARPRNATTLPSPPPGIVVRSTMDRVGMGLGMNGGPSVPFMPTAAPSWCLFAQLVALCM
jgi:hypothetical protein